MAKLGFFPTPYDDELWHSVIARFADYSHFRSTQALMLTIFGKTAAPNVLFPGHLLDVVSNLPPGSKYTPDSILAEHSLLPFYSPFKPPETIENIRSILMGSSSKHVSLNLGLQGSMVKQLHFMRFCPECVVEDKNSVGECYWHRVHQIPGIEVCPKHNSLLVNSDFQIRFANKDYFLSAEKTLKHINVDTKIIDESNKIDNLKMLLAQDAHWLLNHPGLMIDPNMLHQHYTNCLGELGYITAKGYVRTRELLGDIVGNFGKDVLEHLQSYPNEHRRKPWVQSLVQHPVRGYTINPLHHLIFIQFLGYTVESLLKRPLYPQYFGNGPWPCLNPVFDHFLQPVIQSPRISYSAYVKGQLIAEFCCPLCGFAYRRNGPDSRPEDLQRYDKVIDYGQGWRAKLQELIVSGSYSQNEIARILFVSPKAVRENAFKLGLKTPVKRGHGRTSGGYREVAIEKIEANRQEWLALMQTRPTDTVTTLATLKPKLYRWLMMHDKQWLMWVVADREDRIAFSIDWQHRDTELAEKVRQTGVMLRNEIGKPKKITKNRIHQVIKDTHIWNSLDKLPRTAQALEETVDTQKRFIKRRIEFVAEEYKKRGVKCAAPKSWTQNRSV